MCDLHHWSQEAFSVLLKISPCEILGMERSNYEKSRERRRIMKKLYGALFWIPFCLVCAVSQVSADPRMETNKNFCHFILDPINTDNEVFAAGCNSTITVTEKLTASVSNTTECSPYVASGYAKRTETVPATAAPIPAGTSVIWTSKDSGTPCTMVESNGRAYTSRTWQSSIKVTATSSVTRTRKTGASGTTIVPLVQVDYELFCQPDK